MTTRALDTALLAPTDVPAVGEVVGYSAAFRTLWTPFISSVSPIFTGDPQAPTPPSNDNDTSIATTAFVKAQGYATLVSPVFTGNPTAPTPSVGDADTSIATTAFVANSFAPLASPVLTGDPKAPTPSVGDNDTSIATTAFVTAADALKVAKAGDVMTGPLVMPASGTAAATVLNFGTAGSGVFGGVAAVTLAIAGVARLTVGSVSIDAALPVNLPADPTVALGAATKQMVDLKAPLASPVFTGNPTAPTPLAGDSDTSIATTAFVQAAVTAGTAGVASFNTRTGAVVLNATDVDTAGGLLSAGDSMTGVLGLTPGSAAAPAVHFGTAGTGLFGAAGQVDIAISGAQQIQVLTAAVNVGPPMREGDGGPTTPSYSFSSETSSGFYRAAAGDVRLSMGGADCVKFLTTGKVTTFSGAVILAADPAAALNPVTLQYLQAYVIDAGTY